MDLAGVFNYRLGLVEVGILDTKCFQVLLDLRARSSVIKARPHQQVDGLGPHGTPFQRSIQPRAPTNGLQASRQSMGGFHVGESLPRGREFNRGNLPWWLEGFLRVQGLRSWGVAICRGG